VTAELITGVGDFETPVDINLALGKLFKLVATQRIPLREARTLAYISQQILHVVGPMAAGNFGAEGESDDLKHLQEIVGRHAATHITEVG